MKKKILFVMGTLGSGGAEKSLINLLTMMKNKEFEIDLLLFSKTGALIEDIPAHVNLLDPIKEIAFLSSGMNSTNLLKNFSFKGSILRAINILLSSVNKPKSYYQGNQILWERVWNPSVPQLSKEYDVAVAYMHSIPSYYVMDKVKSDRKVLWIHSDYSKLEADFQFDYRYFNKADTIITISDLCRNSLCEAFPHLVHKFKVLHNINSPQVIHSLSNQFVPDEYAEPGKNQVPIFLSIGRLSKTKGFDLAVNAAFILKQRGIKFCWFIIGEGSERERLTSLINKNGLQEYVFLLGLRRNPYPYIKQANIVIQTSRYEGKSIVLDEAKILCKPIVSTNYVSVYDQLQDGETGMLVEMSDKSIADGIERLLHENHLQDYFSSNLRKMDNGTEKELVKYMNYFNGAM
jgi:glycosyltransferase involved in cell wall biosynthesis